MKKILLISDVKGWGGWVRAEYIKKHLSDDFEFTLMDADEFKELEQITNEDCFTMRDIDKFRKRSIDKESLNFNQFKKFFVNNKKMINYDLYYFLFHTMLIKKNVKRMLNTPRRVATIVTGFPTVKHCFDRGKRTSRVGAENFLQLARKCKAIFANNYKSLYDLNKIVSGDNIPTFYMPRGVDEKMFYPTDNGFDPQKKFTVAYVGKPVPEKGLMEFIKPACQTLGVPLLINDRNYMDALGPNEMREFYNKADVYVVASTIDGTPNPALEAASCGKAIISNHIGNMPEFIKHGKNGLLMDERKVNKYVNFLRQMKNNRQRCYNMGREARKTVEQSWTWKKVLENERLAFKEILSGKLQRGKQKKNG